MENIRVFSQMKLFLSVTLCIMLVELLLVFATHKSKNFDAELWRAQWNTDKRDNPRINMIVELEREVLKKGMHRELVREILGSPERIQGNSDLYDLGVSPYGIDYEQLVIQYDQQNKVVNFFTLRG